MSCWAGWNRRFLPTGRYGFSVTGGCQARYCGTAIRYQGLAPLHALWTLWTEHYLSVHWGPAGRCAGSWPERAGTSSRRGAAQAALCPDHAGGTGPCPALGADKPPDAVDPDAHGLRAWIEQNFGLGPEGQHCRPFTARPCWLPSAASRVMRDQSAGSCARGGLDRGRGADAVSSGPGRASRLAVSDGYATRGVCAPYPKCGPPRSLASLWFAKLRRCRPTFPGSDPLSGICAVF